MEHRSRARGSLTILSLFRCLFAPHQDRVAAERDFPPAEERGRVLRARFPSCGRFHLRREEERAPAHGDHVVPRSRRLERTLQRLEVVDGFGDVALPLPHESPSHPSPSGRAGSTGSCSPRGSSRIERMPRKDSIPFFSRSEFAFSVSRDRSPEAPRRAAPRRPPRSPSLWRSFFRSAAIRIWPAAAGRRFPGSPRPRRRSVRRPRWRGKGRKSANPARGRGRGGSAASRRRAFRSRGEVVLLVPGTTIAQLFVQASGLSCPRAPPRCAIFRPGRPRFPAAPSEVLPPAREDRNGVVPRQHRAGRPPGLGSGRYGIPGTTSRIRLSSWTPCARFEIIPSRPRR